MDGDDPRDAEIRSLRKQVAGLAHIVAQMAPREENWVALPSGQCIPGSFVTSSRGQRERAGFRWDGNTAVFPPDWPKIPAWEP